MKFEVGISLTVEAPSGDDAYELAVTAMRYLVATFDQSESIHPYILVKVEPNGTH